MNKKEIVHFCVERGILIDKEVLSLFEGSEDVGTFKIILEKILKQTPQKILTKNVFRENRERVIQFFSTLPTEDQKKLEKLKINLGLSIEISKESFNPNETHEVLQELNLNKENLRKEVNEPSFSDIRILSSNSALRRKIVVKDFQIHLRNRFLELGKILQDRPELNSLISINKISGINQRFSIIGMVYSKRVTKNKNLLFEIEDLTGKIKVVVTQSNQDTYKKAGNMAIDSVIGFKGSGNREILFANEIVFPDAAILERKKSPVDENVLFISDVHVGSKNFMEKNFLKFVDYLNGKIPNTPEAEKIKYLFIVGDLVAGVGVHPNQEKGLEIKDLEGQYLKMAELLGKIRKDINIIAIPGNHDCVRLMEPQPILDEKYAWPLYNLRNVVLSSNPSLVNMGAKKNFSGFNVLAYHGFSYYYYANNIPCLIEEKATSSPDKVMKYLLMNRHVAPTHTSAQISPSEDDGLLMKKVPDIFVSGHTHTNAVSYYNNILLISNSCWEKLMPYQEKMGFKSDYCKVPMFNLKTRKIKILDFYEENEDE